MEALPYHTSQEESAGPHVRVKVCPDCELLDAEAHDPRCGRRPATAFGRNWKTADGLAGYCRHHMGQRRKHERPTPAPDTDPCTGEPEEEEGLSWTPRPAASVVQGAATGVIRNAMAVPVPAPSVSPPVSPPAVSVDQADVLIAALAALEVRITGTEQAQHVLAERLSTIEDLLTSAPQPAARDAVAATLADQQARLLNLEQAEWGGEGPSEPDVSTGRALKRGLKQVLRTQARHTQQIEVLEGRCQEATQLAKAAARMGAQQRQAEGGEILAALEERLAERIRAIMDAKLGDWDSNAGTATLAVGVAAPASDQPQPHVAEDIALHLVRRFSSALRSLVGLEQSGLISSSDVATMQDALERRMAQHLCRSLGPGPDARPEQAPEP